MYFEKRWYIVLCVRLNCLHVKLMTSNVVDENISDDFEEGEIIDDDSPVSSQQDSWLNKSCAENICFKVKRPSSDYPIELDCETSEHLSFCRTRRRSQQSTSSFRVRGAANPNFSAYSNNTRVVSRNATSVGRKGRQGNGRRLTYRSTCRKYPGRHPKVIGNERDRSKSDIPYEERLKDFRLRQRRNSCRSRSPEKKPKRTHISSLVDTENSGTSLLKRLVGSGSFGIKVIDDNLSEQSKHSVAVSSFKSPSTEEITVCDKVNDSVHDDIEESESISISQTKNDNEADEVNQLLSTDDKGFNENVSSPHQAVDDEWELRMEALKTVVLKKHNERLKRGLIPKKIVNKSCHSIVDSFIEELESINSFAQSDGSEDDLNEVNIKNSCGMNDTKNDECSDMSMDSNYVSDEESTKQELRCPDYANVSPFEISDPLSQTNNSQPRTSVPMEISEEDSKNSDVDSNITFDMTEEELQLRALALQSFLKKKEIKDNCAENDSASLNVDLSESQPKDDFENSTDVRDGEEIKFNKKRKELEDWEELDEDILRAQLLEKLSSKLPEHNAFDLLDETNRESIGLKVQKLSRPSSSKKESDIDRESRIWSEKMVPELIISLNESDFESEPETQAICFEKSLDLFLREAKQKSESLPPTETKPKLKNKTALTKFFSKKQMLKNTSSTSTPVAVKHLSVHQQEEYRRLKMKLVQKMASTPVNNPLQIKSKEISSKSSGKISSSSMSSESSTKQLARKSESVNPVIKKFKPDSQFALKKNQIASKQNVNINKRVGLSNVSLPKKPVAVKAENKFAFKMENSALVKPIVALKTETKLVNKKPASLVSNSMKTNVELKNKVSGRPKEGNRQYAFKSSTTLSKQNLQMQSSALKSFNKEIVKTSLSDSGVGEKNAKLIVKSDHKLVNSPKLVDSAKQHKEIEFAIQLGKDNNSLSKREGITGSTKDINLVIESDKKSCAGVNQEVELSVLREKEIFVVPDKRGGAISSSDIANDPLRRVTNRIQKDSDGNSDKENEVTKADRIGAFNSSLDSLVNGVDRSSPSTLENESEPCLVTKLQDAQVKYGETLALISKLERELEAAKKELLSRGKILLQLKEQIGPSGPSSLNVKISNGAGFGAKVDSQQADNKPSQDTEGFKCSWDPDGVLCPYQLAGSCKDPLCSFHHIPTS